MKKPGFLLSDIWTGVKSLVLCNASMADETMSAPSHQSGPMPLNKEFQETPFQTEYPTTHQKKKIFVPKSSSYGCDFALYPLKMSTGGARGVEAHILGLGRIQLERIHKAGTRTKLLAVLVWLPNRTTLHQCQIALGNIMKATMADHLWFIYMSLNLLLELMPLTHTLRYEGSADRCGKFYDDAPWLACCTTCRVSRLKWTKSYCRFTLFINWYFTVWANELLAQQCKQSQSTPKRNKEVLLDWHNGQLFTSLDQLHRH